MKYTAALLRMLSLSFVLLLSACSSTQGPQYPAQLQMIIAQAASQSVGLEDAGADAHKPQSQAISVEQLLANVKASKRNNSKSKAITSLLARAQSPQKFMAVILFQSGFLRAKVAINKIE